MRKIIAAEMGWAAGLVAVALMAGSTETARAAIIKATYEFDHTLAPMEAGAPALTLVDPLGSSDYSSDVVLGQTRPVFNLTGNNSPSNQSGFQVSTAGLISPTSYSVDMVFLFSERNGGYRRVLDVQNRASDNGFYVDPGNNLSVYPVNGSSAGWTNNVYHHVVLTVDGNMVSAYLDGLSQFGASTNLMNLNLDPVNNPTALMTVFLDNNKGGGQGEWSASEISLLRFWDGALSSQEANVLAANPYVPEPGMSGGAGILVFGVLGHRRRGSGRR